VQDEKKVDDTAKDLVSGFELLMGETCDPLDWRIWRTHGQKIMQGQLRSANLAKTLCEVEIVWKVSTSKIVLDGFPLPGEVFTKHK
jgi:hypothetical protein